jgi:hypothetical protein
MHQSEGLIDKAKQVRALTRIYQQGSKVVILLGPANVIRDEPLVRINDEY